MDEMNWSLPPGLESAMQAYYGSPEPPPSFAEGLERELRRRSGQTATSWGPRTVKILRACPVLALLVLLLILLLLTGIAYAIGRLSGYIPGFGFTSGTQVVMVLESPVEQTTNGITLRVDQAISDESRFWVEIREGGVPDRRDFSRAYLLLPDGGKVQSQMGASISPTGDETLSHYIFPPLRGMATQLSLLIEGLGGETFHLSLHMRPLRTDEVVPAIPSDGGPLQSETQGGVALVLEQVARTSTETILQVALHFDRPNLMLNGPWNVVLTDEQGNRYPMIDRTPDTMDMSRARIYKTVPFTGGEQLTLRLVNASPPAGKEMLAMLGFPDQQGQAPSFAFDPGSHCEVGQIWQLNEVLQAGDFNLHLRSARLVSPSELLFEFEPVENVTGVMLWAAQASGPAGGSATKPGDITAGIHFTSLPTGPFEIRLTSVFYEVSGTWEIHWTPAVAPAAQPRAPAPPSTSVPTIEATASPTVIASDPFLLQISSLLQKFNAHFQSGPAWVHVLMEGTQRPSPAGITYPPPVYTREEWYEIDADGYVTRLLTTDRDASGSVIQQAAMVGNYSINFTEGSSGYNPDTRFRFALDDVSGMLRYDYQQGWPVAHENVIYDGQPCVVVFSREPLGTPVKNPGETQAFTGAGQRIWINSESGQELRRELLWQAEDDSEVVEATFTYQIVEKEDAAPPDVLAVLGTVVVP